MPQALNLDLIEVELLRIRAATEGWVARSFNKPVSFAITRRLLRTAVTPNQITAFNLLIALLAAFCVAWGEYPVRILGALLIQFHSILDGCDGEVARLKGSASKFGAWFDTLTDDFSNNLFFAALFVGLWHTAQAGWILGLGVIVLGESVALSAIIIHYLVTVADTGRAQDFRLAWERKGAVVEEQGPPTVYTRFAKPLLKRDFFLLMMAIAIVLDLRLPFLLLASIGVTCGFVIYALSFALAAKQQAFRG